MVQLTSLRLLETLDVFSSSVTDSGVAEGLSWLPALTSLEVLLNNNTSILSTRPGCAELKGVQTRQHMATALGV